MIKKPLYPLHWSIFAVFALWSLVSCNLFSPRPAAPTVPTVQEQTVSEVNAQGVSSEQPNPLILRGITAGGSLELSGQFNFNQLLAHGNTGFKLNGTFALNASSITAPSNVVCLDTAQTGMCTNARASQPQSALTLEKPTANLADAWDNYTPRAYDQELQGDQRIDNQADADRIFPKGSVIKVNGSVFLGTGIQLKDVTLFVTEQLHLGWNNTLIRSVLMSPKLITTDTSPSSQKVNLSLESSVLLSKIVMLGDLSSSGESSVLATDGIYQTGILNSSEQIALISNKDMVLGTRGGKAKAVIWVGGDLQISSQGLESTSLEGLEISVATFLQSQQNSNEVSSQAVGGLPQMATLKLEGGITAVGKVILRGKMEITKGPRLENVDLPGYIRPDKVVPLSVRGILKPGGTLEGPDGVVLKAPDTMMQDAEIEIARVDPKTVPALDGRAFTGMYKILFLNPKIPEQTLDPFDRITTGMEAGWANPLFQFTIPLPRRLEAIYKPYYTMNTSRVSGLWLQYTTGWVFEEDGHGSDDGLYSYGWEGMNDGADLKKGKINLKLHNISSDAQFPYVITTSIYRAHDLSENLESVSKSLSEFSEIAKNDGKNGKNLFQSQAISMEADCPPVIVVKILNPIEEKDLDYPCTATAKNEIKRQVLAQIGNELVINPLPLGNLRFDMKLPENSGFALAGKIQLDPNLSDIPNSVFNRSEYKLKAGQLKSHPCLQQDTANGVYGKDSKKLFFCTKGGNLKTDPTDSLSITYTVRHELMHSIQMANYTKAGRTGVYSSINYSAIIEGAARTAERSNGSVMNLSKRTIESYKIGPPMILNAPYIEAARFQDFLVYLGRINQHGLSYLKEVFSETLKLKQSTIPFTTANNISALGDFHSSLTQIFNDGLSYAYGLEGAYWGYESWRTEVARLRAETEILQAELDVKVYEVFQLEPEDIAVIENFLEHF